MKIELRCEQAYDEAAARAATGRSLGEWFGLLDSQGGPQRGRREIGNQLINELKLDPWWSSTIIGEYEAAHGLREKDGRLRGYTICATKSIKADPDHCMRGFATAPALDHWLGPAHELDFRDGGSLRNGDGNVAVLRKLNPGKTLKLVWAQPGVGEDTPVEVKFAANGAKTTVMITHERLQTRAEADGLRAAWGEALDRLKAWLETL